MIHFSPFYLVRTTEIVVALDSEGISLQTILRINPLALYSRKLYKLMQFLQTDWFVLTWL